MGVDNKECTKEKEEIRKLLTELEFDVKSLPKDGIPMHPIRWQINEIKGDCKKMVEEILRFRNEKTKTNKKVAQSDSYLSSQTIYRLAL